MELILSVRKSAIQLLANLAEGRGADLEVVGFLYSERADESSLSEQPCSAINGDAPGSEKVRSNRLKSSKLFIC